MWNFLKALLSAVAVRMLRDYRRLSCDLVKIQAVGWYVKGVAGARLAFLGYVALCACLLLAAIGFIFLHIGVFLLLPMSLKMKAVILSALGVAYLAIPLLVLRRAASQATWMKIFKADKLVAKVAGTAHGAPSK